MKKINQTASEEMQQAAALLRAQGLVSTNASIEDMRANMEQMQSALLPLQGADITDVSISAAGLDIPSRWHSMPQSSTDRVILYLHGGGYALGSLNTHRELMVRLADSTASRVLGIDYRLAPEHPFPAALDDALAAYQWLVKEEGVPASHIIIAGDSAGGGLSLALMLSLRDQLGTPDALPMPVCGVLFSPWTDLAATGGSIKSMAEQDPMIDANALERIASFYHASLPANHPLVSPLYNNFKGLPPLLVQVGEHEILLDDSLRLQKLAENAGVELVTEVYAQAFHVFQAFPGLPEADGALQRVNQFLDSHHIG